MSSRNSRLTVEQRAAAPVLHQALTAATALLESGQLDGDKLRQAMTSIIAAEPLARLDYVSVADPQTLTELARVERRALFSLAVFFDQVRIAHPDIGIVVIQQDLRLRPVQHLPVRSVSLELLGVARGLATCLGERSTLSARSSSVTIPTRPSVQSRYRSPGSTVPSRVTAWVPSSGE